MASKRISVVLIVKNEPIIKETLALLYPQVLEVKAECVVVDASTSPLGGLSIEFPWVRWINFLPKEPERKITIAEQRNLGVAECTGDIIVFCDAGGTPELNWLKNLVGPLLSNEYQLVGGPIRATNDASGSNWVNLQSDGEEIQYPSTANLALTRSAFNLVGGFDESLDYGSDADFVWRLNSQGIKEVCVASSVMGLDGGTSHRERRRAWRYGKALADLLWIHPEKRIVKLKQNPELLVYMILILMPLFFFLPKSFYIFDIICWLFLNLILLIKNQSEKNCFEVILNHYIYEFGLIYRSIIKCLPTLRVPKVAVYPSSDSKYFIELQRALFKQRNLFNPPREFPEITPSATLNLILLPFTSLFLRLRGLRIIHIHWLYKFGLVWTPKMRVDKFIVQIWFKFWIKSLEILGIKIIWTAHNLMPHEIIFKDDLAMRKYLIEHCAVVIALSEESKIELTSNFGAENAVVIREGALTHPTTYSREEFRKLLGVKSEQILIVALGQLGKYKGIEDLLLASSDFKPQIALRIAGRCSSEYLAKLEGLQQIAVEMGADVQIEFGVLSENVYGAYLNAADFYVAPFIHITNSGSINAAITSGLPVIIPDLKSLSWVPELSAIRFNSETERISALTEAINSTIGISQDDLDVLREAAGVFVSQRDWSLVAKSHIDLYKSMIDPISHTLELSAYE